MSLMSLTNNPIQRQIAELNIKRKAEHDQVDKNYDQLIELVRARCVHEYPKSLWLHDCIHCGQTKPLGIQSAEPLAITDEQIEKLQNSLKTIREQQKIEQWS